MEQFTYLGSVVSRDGGTDRDIKSRTGKATAASETHFDFTGHLRQDQTSVCLFFNVNVKSGLLYACETWRITKALTHIVQTSINRCLRAILHIKWQDKITNEEIWRRTGQAQTDPRSREESGIGSATPCKHQRVARHALKWNP